MMSVEKRSAQKNSVPLSKPLAWWKKLLISVFGTYVAAKFFGILVPDISSIGLASPQEKHHPSSEPYPPTDEYPDDTWDIPDDDEYEYPDEYDETDECDPLDIYGKDDDLLHNDWNDWGEGYDDDHFD